MCLPGLTQYPPVPAATGQHGRLPGGHLCWVLPPFSSSLGHQEALGHEMRDMTSSQHLRTSANYRAWDRCLQKNSSCLRQQGWSQPVIYTPDFPDQSRGSQLKITSSDTSNSE